MQKKKKHKGNPWADHYTRQAKMENYPARSVYKLKEIQKKYRVLQKGQSILDLGCSPGSWLLYAAEIVGAQGNVYGIDLKPAEIKQNVQNIHVFTGDFLDPSPAIEAVLNQEFQVILSDMAPATTGIKSVDAERSHQLCQAAFKTAQLRLAHGGAFVCKIFQGEAFKPFVDSVQTCFTHTKIFKPETSRKASKEIYIIGLRKKNCNI